MFYHGVVEARNDPLELGRVRVRIVGIHTPDKTLMPTDTLPWATVMHPVTSTANSGVGITPKLVEGAFVVVYFLDGEDMQQPMIMGTIAGIQEEFNIAIQGSTLPRDDTKGFNTNPADNYVGESDLPKLSRSGPVDKPRTRERVQNRLFTIEEPSDLRQYRQYPYSQVKQSETGHYEEWDDTPNNERLNKEHRSGTYEEIRPDGSKVVRVVGDNYEVIHMDNHVYVNGSCMVHVHGKADMFFDSDLNVEVGGNYNLRVRGNYTEQIGGSNTTTIHGQSTHVIGMQANTYVSSTYNVESTGSMYMRAPRIDWNDRGPTSVSTGDYEYTETTIETLQPDLTLQSTQDGTISNDSDWDQLAEVGYRRLSR